MGILLDQRSVALEFETSMSPRRLAILASPFVTAQPRFDAHGRLIGAGVSVCRERVSLEHNAGVEMDHALGAKAEAVPAYGHGSGKPAVEVFGHRFRETRIDALAQRLADPDVFARHAKWHDRPPMRWSLDHSGWMDMTARAAHAHRALCGASQFAAKRAAAQYHRWCVRRPRQARPVSRAAAALTRQFASPRDILQRSAGQCRSRPRAASRRWCRRTARSRDFRRRSVA